VSEKSTIIIGHKNPDTDSICSAIGYAALKKALGEEGIIAARAGNINPQTAFVLRYFNQESPVYLSDVYPKVRDVMTTDIASAQKNSPLCTVINSMGAKNARFMPITEEGRPVGLLSLSTLAEQLIVRTPSPTREVYTSIRNVVEALQARPIYMVSAEEEFTATVFVGAMAEESFRDVIERCNPRDCIVIVGDREVIQKAAIARGVRLLVITGGLDVIPEILRLAKDSGVSVIVSPFDSATTAWLTLLSSPVGHFCSRDYLVVSENEVLREFRSRIKEGMGVVADANGRLSGVIAPADLLRPSGIRLILVDHNELSQAVDGASEVEISEVIDHHRLGNFHTSMPIRFVNEPVGSTSTLIAERFFRKGIDPERAIAGLLLSGIISDTLMLKSPTATERDLEMVDKLSAMAGIDPVTYAQELFRAGSGLSGKAPLDIIKADFKAYNVKGKRFGIGQVEVVGFGEFYDVRSALEEGLLRLKEAEEYSLAGLLVTDISYGNSLLLAISDSEVSSALGYPSVGKNLYDLKGVLSRKKQVVPHILNLFSKLYEK
jgi:manganese-dependent inorganic pyrophosphatase